MRLVSFSLFLLFGCAPALAQLRAPPGEQFGPDELRLAGLHGPRLDGLPAQARLGPHHTGQLQDQQP